MYNYQYFENKKKSVICLVYWYYIYLLYLKILYIYIYSTIFGKYYIYTFAYTISYVLPKIIFVKIRNYCQTPKKKKSSPNLRFYNIVFLNLALKSATEIFPCNFELPCISHERTKCMLMNLHQVFHNTYVSELPFD